MNFANYGKSLGIGGVHTDGQRHSYEAQDIIEHTWYNDPSSVTAYLYSWEYDDEKDKNVGLHPQYSKTKIPVDVKYFINTYQSLNKDNVDYRIMFKPSYKCNVPYYKDLFEKKVGAEFPIGLYIDLPDRDGIYRRWLIVAGANTDNRDFPNWSVLFCDYDFKWVYKQKKYHCWGVGRSQNSYNSGEWTDFRVTNVENQRKFVLPYNDVSKTIFYNQRIALSPPLETPIAWHVSKVEGLNPLGIMYYTLAQESWDFHTDVIEYDDEGNVIGMWCDLNADANLPSDTEDSEHDGTYAEITYSGSEPHIKVNGSYKTVTVTYYNSKELVKDQTPGEWSYWIDNTDASDLIETLSQEDDNAIKVKFIGDEEYLGKVLTVRNTRDNIVAQVDLQIVSL